MSDAYSIAREEAAVKITDQEKQAIKTVARLIAKKSFGTENATEEEEGVVVEDLEQAMIKALSSSVFSFIGIHIRREHKTEGPFGFENCVGRLVAPSAPSDQDKSGLMPNDIIPQALAAIVAKLLNEHGNVELDARGMREMFVQAIIMRKIAELEEQIGDDDECDGCGKCHREEMPEA